MTNVMHPRIPRFACLPLVSALATADLLIGCGGGFATSTLAPSPDFSISVSPSTLSEQAGLRGSRQLKDRRAALVLVAVEKRGKASGLVRMAVIPDFKAATILPFLSQNIELGATIHTDGLKSFAGLSEAGYKHIAPTQPLRSELRKGAKSVVPLADRAIGNLQQ